MATITKIRNTNNGKNGNGKAKLVSRIDLIRAKIDSMLRDAELQTAPLVIDPEVGIDFYDRVARFETHLIETALEASGGRQNQAARLLGLRNSTLSWKIKRLEIRTR